MCREHPQARGYSSFLSVALVFAICSAFVLLTAGATSAVARDVEREHALKAGYLFNFMKFVEWPSLPSAGAFTICFLGSNGVHDALTAVLPDKRLVGHRLVAHQLSAGEAFTDCQVLYIGAEQNLPVTSIANVGAQALLTVSDSAGFLQNGGVIELFTEGNRLRFRISLENARHAQLRISSGLLQLASSVETEKRRP